MVIADISISYFLAWRTLLDICVTNYLLFGGGLSDIEPSLISGCADKKRTFFLMGCTWPTWPPPDFHVSISLEKKVHRTFTSIMKGKFTFCGVGGYHADHLCRRIEWAQAWLPTHTVRLSISSVVILDGDLAAPHARAHARSCWCTLTTASPSRDMETPLRPDSTTSGQTSFPHTDSNPP